MASHGHIVNPRPSILVRLASSLGQDKPDLASRGRVGLDQVSAQERPRGLSRAVSGDLSGGMSRELPGRLSHGLSSRSSRSLSGGLSRGRSCAFAVRSSDGQGSGEHVEIAHLTRAPIH